MLEEYGTERLSFVLACTVQYKQTDGRFSRDTKAWAERTPVPENISRGMDLNLDYVVNDAYGVNPEREYQYFPDLDSALTAYAMLPNHLIDLVPHYKESPLVQKAVADLEHILSQRQEQAKEAEKTAEKGRGTKQSVIQALSQWREKQKEKDKAEKRNMEKSGVYKKGEIEL